MVMWIGARQPLILDMDTAGRGALRTWIVTRPYFDVLIDAKRHTVSNARDGRMHFDKPYIGQESWDDAPQNTPTASLPIACTRASTCGNAWGPSSGRWKCMPGCRLLPREASPMPRGA
jgi:hypothetical protein